jgi:hypothetical protein
MMNSSIYAVKRHEQFAQAQQLEATIRKNLEALGYGE